MLVLKKKGVSAKYRLIDSNSDRVLALVVSDGSWRRGSAEIDGRSIAFAERSGDVQMFSASVDGSEIALATQTASGMVQWTIDANGDIWRMTCTGVTQRPFDLTDEHGTQVGTVALRGATGRRIEIDVPDSVAFDLRLFAGWLATRHYNKAANVRIVQ